MSWFKRLLPSTIRTDRTENGPKKAVPEGLWSKCSSCDAVLYRAELERNLFVCPKCNHHEYISARKRIDTLLDAEDRVEIATDVLPFDHLKFRDSKKYKDRLAAAQKSTEETEALLVLKGKLKTVPVVLGVFEFSFIGGSMGAAVGERFAQAVHAAVAAHIPFICISSSGGARMQEALFSLMQMAKTSAALTKLAEARLPFISVLTDPTMGGVSASFAMLGDIIVAEPGALIGFAGPRVIEQTVRATLPEGFQSAEFLLEHGAIDMIIDRREMRDTLARLVSKLLH